MIKRKQVFSPLKFATSENGIKFGIIRYLYDGGDTTTEANAQYPINQSMIHGMGIKPANNTLDNSCIITVRKNGVDTPLSATIPAGSNAKFTVDDKIVFFDDLDFLSIEVDTTASTAGNLNVLVTLLKSE